MPSDPKSPKLSLGKVALFTLILVGLVFGGVELALVAIDYPPASALSGEDGDHPNYWITEANLDKGAFLHKELGTNFYVSTNSQHLRYKEVPVGRQPGVLRVMALGDSTTFGWGVEQEDTYPQVLEGMLQGKAPGMEIQVINGGVPGYSSFQGLHHMHKRVLQYAADIYLFGYIVQDARAAPVSDQDQAISSRSREFFELNPLYQWRTYLLMRNTYQKYRSARQEELAKGSSTTRVPPDQYADNLRQLGKLALGADGVPVMFGFPLEVVGYTKAHREVMLDVAEAQGWDHFDPSQVLFEEARQRTLYFPKDKGHPNAAGCQVIAREVAGWLVSSGLLERVSAARQ